MRKLLRVHVKGGLALFAIALILLALLITVRFRILSWISPMHNMGRVAAEKALADGDQLRNEWKAESRRGAIKKYEEALAYWKATGEWQAEASAFRKIGEVYNSLGERQKARDYYNQALSLYQEARDPQGEGETLNDIGYVCLYSGKSKEALEFCNKALELSRNVGNRRGEADALNKIGEVYYFFGDMQKSLDFDNKALSLWLDLGDRRGQAQTLMHLGHAYSDLSETQKASDLFNQALQLWRALNDHRGRALTLIALGRANSRLGEKQQALDLFNQAMELIQPMSDRELEARALNGIGYVYDELGEMQKALEYYKQALELYRVVGLRKGEAGQLYRIGVVYFSLGDNQKALDYYQQALSIIRASSDQRLEPPVLRYIGMVYDSLGNKNTALTYYNQSLQLIRDKKDRQQEAYTLNNIGQVYGWLGNRQKALHYYNQALPLNQATRDRFGESLTLYNIAHVERDRRNLSAARSRIEASLKIVESLRIKVASQDLRTSYFASIHRRYEFYTGLLMLLHKQSPTKGLDVAALEANERACARSLLELLTEARANIRQGINPELLERERLVQQLLNDKAERQARLLGGKHTEEEASTISNEIQELTTNYDQVKAQIRVESPRYAALTQPQPLKLKEIQLLLDNNTLLLEYALGSERSYLWAVTRTELKNYELPGLASIEKAAQPVHDLLISRQPAPGQTEKQRDAQYWQQASELSRMLLGPVAGQLGAKRLLIVADGVLQYIPFGALPLPETERRGDGETERQRNRKKRNLSPRPSVPPSLRPSVSHTPLIVEHEIVNLPSASTLAVLRRETEKRQPAPKVVAVLADPVFEADDRRALEARGLIKGATERQVASNLSPQKVSGQGLTRDGINLQRLYSTLREAEAIRRIVPAADGLFALGFDANRARATSDELRQYRIVHFATHGILDDQNPELSAIALSLFDRQGKQQDGFLRLHDIYNLNLPAELVVLSACDSALGKEIKGEGLVGLTRGFMYAGAPRVLASLWKVDDESTAALMEQFYRRMLNDRMSPAAALREAQVAIWRQPQWRAPYYWAAFVMQGEWK